MINLIILFDLFDFVCLTGDYILTGFGRDQAVNRCVTGASIDDRYFCHLLAIFNF
jgi:hypothetical protein